SISRISAWLEPEGSAPTSVIRFCRSGCFAAAAISRCRRAMTGSGGPLGAKKPFQPRRSRLGKPSSRVRATSGSAAEPLGTASAHVLQRARKLVAAELYSAGQQLLHQRSGAAKRYMIHLDPGIAFEHFAHQVHDAAGAGGTVEQRLFGLLRVVHELLEVARG